MQYVLKALHPGGIRTNELPFLRRMSRKYSYQVEHHFELISPELISHVMVISSASEPEDHGFESPPRYLKR
jgi:hypothetical protein